MTTRAPAAAPRRGVAALRSPAPAALALLVAGALISGFTILRGGAPFDEGIVLQAARRVTDGQIPYRDFDWAYGPLQPYVLGATFEGFGQSLLGWRVLRVVCDAGVALLAFVIVRREAPLVPALAAWLAVACAMAQPTSATPTAPALLCAVAAIAVASSRREDHRRTAVYAGALVALTAAWRLDFALYGGAAVVVVLAFAHGGARDRRRRVGLFVLVAVVAGAVVYAPFAALMGPADLYAELLGESLDDRDFWTLPLPLSYDGSARAWPPAALVEDLKDLLGFYVPLLLLAGLALAVAMSALIRRHTKQWPPPVALGMLALGGGGLAYLLSRADEFHATPLLVAVVVALAVLGGRLGRERGDRAVHFAAAVVLGLLVAHGALNRGSALVRPPDLASIELPAADGAKAPPGEAEALERTVREVTRVVRPERPIYTITRRSDLVRFNQPLLYVLADRDNPTRADYGLQTSASAQRRLVEELRAAAPGAVVRWNDPITTVREPNLRGRPSGSRLLDAYVAANYRQSARFGEYEVLVPR